MSSRAAIYARMSTDRQNEQSPADQIAENLGKMTVGINMANMNLRTFFEAAKFGGPVIDKLGGDISDATALFGALANVGIKGSLGGTAVRSLTRVLIPKGKKGRRAARVLGVTKGQLTRKGIEEDGRMMLQSDKGASSVEYAILAALIAAVVVGIVLLLGQEVADMFGLDWWS